MAVPNCCAWWALSICMHYLCPKFSQIISRFTTNCCAAINFDCPQEERHLYFAHRLLPDWTQMYIQGNNRVISWILSAYLKSDQQNILADYLVNANSQVKHGREFLMWVLKAHRLHHKKRGTNIPQLRTGLHCYCSGLQS